MKPFNRRWLRQVTRVSFLRNASRLDIRVESQFHESGETKIPQGNSWDRFGLGDPSKIGWLRCVGEYVYGDFVKVNGEYGVVLCGIEGCENKIVSWLCECIWNSPFLPCISSRGH